MKFLIVTLAPTLKKDNKFYSYAPYVFEMNLWSKYVTELGIVSPIIYKDKLLLSSFDTKPKVFKIKSIVFNSLINCIKSSVEIPFVLFKLYKAMQWADHIHLRCPGNIGLLGCLVQIMFPKKPKTVKYAGNWDPNSKQPLSYRQQKWIVSNTFLTKNCQVLVYGEWVNQTKNIKPFFTASYSEKEKKPITVRELNNSNLDTIKFIFVGMLSKGKQPLLSIQTIHKLLEKGYNAQLDIYGEGIERENIEKYIIVNKLEKNIILHGNKNKEIVKLAYQKAHFLIIISKSEGWPKVVAEAMFWGCLPITSNVSCIAYMLNKGNRGAIVNSNVEEIVEVIESYINNTSKYKKQVEKAMEWSRQFTLEKFELEIGKLLSTPLNKGIDNE